MIEGSAMILTIKDSATESGPLCCGFRSGQQ
jgi:hypothetical protein